MSRKRSHAALRPGSQLWQVFCFLRDRGAAGATSLELAEHFQGINLNISTTAADIRKCAPEHGYVMLPAKFEGKRGEGKSARKVYRYRLVRVGQSVRESAVEKEALVPAERSAGGVSGDLFGDSRKGWG